jgi:hypothetical protein
MAWPDVEVTRLGRLSDGPIVEVVSQQTQQVEPGASRMDIECSRQMARCLIEKDLPAFGMNGLRTAKMSGEVTLGHNSPGPG